MIVFWSLHARRGAGFGWWQEPTWAGLRHKTFGGVSEIARKLPRWGHLSVPFYKAAGDGG